MDTEQEWCSPSLALLPGVGVFVAAMILAVILALSECSVAEGVGQDVVIFLGGRFLNLVKSNPIIFCFSSGAGAGLSSLVEGIGHDLVANKFAAAGKVESHGVVALEGFNFVGGVVVVVVLAVVNINVAGTWVAQGVFQLTSPCMASC